MDKMDKKEYMKKWKEKNKEHIKKYKQKPEVKTQEKEYRGRPEVKRRKQEWSEKHYQNPENRNKRKKISKKYYQEHKEQQLESCKRTHRERRKLILEHYGNKCACCGETTPEFLTIDHINNDGYKRRKIEGVGNKFYRWIIKNNYPKDLQILCWNCNCAKSRYGKCPHQK